MTEKIIYEELTKLGGSVSVKGFDYSIAGIRLLLDDINMPITNLYVDVAIEKNTTSSRVERAIRQYIESIFKLSNNKDNYKHINFKLNKNGFPRNSEFLKSIVYYLKFKEE